jgi:hypothetical protein
LINAKLVAFVVIVALFATFALITVPYKAVNGLAAIPDSERGDVVVSSINGNIQSLGDDFSSEMAPAVVGVDTWSSTSNTVFIDPSIVAQGCTTQYSATFTISYTLSNRLPSATKGSVLITVTENKTGGIISQKIIPISLTPYARLTGSTTFTVTAVDDPSPTFTAGLMFPTEADINSISPVRSVPLFEYLLYSVGLTP